MSAHLALRTLAKQAENVERVVIAIENQIRRFTEDGWPEAAFLWSEEQVPALRAVRSQLMAQLAPTMEGTRLAEWVRETTGLGPAVFFVLGLMPPLEEFRTVSAVWKYSGLHVADGRAPKRSAGEGLGFNVRRRAYVLMRVADPCMRKRTSPYRAVYDRRKAHTQETHPDMLPAGAGCEFCDRAYERTKKLRAERQFERERTAVAIDCANLGGAHWAPKHRHADALRVMAKAILRDAWRVAHGMEPKGGDRSEDQRPDAHPEADRTSSDLHP